MDPLGGREQVGVDRRGTDRSPDLPHGFADGVEERATGILHEVPSVGDLGSFRQGLRDRHGVAATTIPGDDFDLLLVRKPSLSGRRLSVGEQSDCPPPFEVADDCPVALVSPPRPVVDADHGWRDKARRAAAADHAEQGVLAHREQKASGEALSGAAAQRKTDMMHDGLQAGTAACPRLYDTLVEPFGENRPRAIRPTTSEAPNLKPNPNLPAVCG